MAGVSGEQRRALQTQDRTLNICLYFRGQEMKMKKKTQKNKTPKQRIRKKQNEGSVTKPGEEGSEFQDLIAWVSYLSVCIFR